MARIRINLDGTIDYDGSLYVRARECRMGEAPMGYGILWRCSRCGTDNAGVWDESGTPVKPTYCPACRAKVVADEQ